MDDSLLLMKGGKDGIVITKGNAEESEMIKRVVLSLDNEDHMPPKEKPQLTKDQVALLHWWIDNGAATDKQVKAIPQPPDIKQKLLALQTVERPKETVSDIPSKPVEAGDETTINNLRTKQILVMPVAQGSNYLVVSFIADTIVAKEELISLQKLSKQLIWLKLANTNLNDSLMNEISKLNALIRLDVSNTLITDKGLQKLSSLSHLQYLNLVNTKVTSEGILLLKNNKALASLFLYKTNVDKGNYAQLKNAFPKTMIDTGGYVVPTLATDTTDVKMIKKEY